ncbi:hypothetical protein [Marinactinospora rubrisoli]|uniref:Uncharacterized protein n=1 Tax=Marinactinospora rubrisoli TaxID=2715399 RepID=A0ABW2KG57_9ACTN
MATEEPAPITSKEEEERRRAELAAEMANDPIDQAAFTAQQNSADAQRRSGLLDRPVPSTEGRTRHDLPLGRTNISREPTTRGHQRAGLNGRNAPRGGLR